MAREISASAYFAAPSGTAAPLLRVLMIGALGATTACTEANEAANAVARRSAKAAVAETLATRFPQVPQAAVTPFSDCIIDNATAREIGEFAKDAVIGVSETTATLVRSVLERPATQQCFVRAGVAALGG